MGGTFAEKSSSPFKLRHQLSPQQLQSCQESSKDRQKMLWIDLKTILDVRFIACSVTNPNILFSSVLSLFTIVSFKNDACVSGTGNNGTCYSSSDCSKLGGTASGSCASGFGVCCLCKSDFKSLLYVFSWNLRNTTLDRTLPFICRRILRKINHIVLTRLWLQAAASYDVSSSSSYWAINF